MWNQWQRDTERARLRYQIGDRVRIVQGVDRGRSGEVVDVYPASARPYMVRLSDDWYVHFAEDRLARLIEPGTAPAFSQPGERGSLPSRN